MPSRNTSGPSKPWAGKLKKGRALTEVAPGIPDGFRVDIDGAIWTSAGRRR